VSLPSVPVLIASRSPAYAEGLRAFLRGTPLLPVVCHTVHHALRLVERRAPRLAIIDWALADAPGVELALELARNGQKATRIVFSVEPGVERVAQEAQATAAGADACVLVTSTREAILETVASVLDARVDAMVAQSMGELVARTNPRRVLLTPQERAVLRLMRQQLTYKEIALELGVSWHTVRSHAQSILRKLGVHSRRDLAGWDARLGIEGLVEVAAA